MIIKPNLQKPAPKLELSAQPEGFYIIVDTREQNPYFKSLDYAIVKKLSTGDYSIKGFEDQITIERKEVDDLLICIGKERKRFQRELERMREFFWKGIVVEGKEIDLYTSVYSELSPLSIRWSLVSFRIKYGVHIYFAKDRENGERWVHDHLYYYFTRKREGKI